MNKCEIDHQDLYEKYGVIKSRNIIGSRLYLILMEHEEKNMSLVAPYYGGPSLLVSNHDMKCIMPHDEW